MGSSTRCFCSSWPGTSARSRMPRRRRPGPNSGTTARFPWEAVDVRQSSAMPASSKPRCSLTAMPIEGLYPLDVDRAFQEPRPARQSATSSGTPPTRSRFSNSAPARSRSGRRSTAASIPADRHGAKIGFTPDYGGVSGDYLGVVKTSANAAEAFRLIDYIVSDTRGRLPSI